MTVIFAAGHEAVSGKLMISSIPLTKDTFKAEVWWKRQSTLCKEKKNPVNGKEVYKGLEGQKQYRKDLLFLRSLCPSQFKCGDLLFISLY